MPGRILITLLSRLTARRAMFGSALGLLLLPHEASSTKQGKRRKKKKRELRRRAARWNARRPKKVGRQFEAECLAEATEPGLVCPEELAACCHHLRNLDVDGYCWCLLLETCGSCCVGYPGCDY